MNKYLTPLGKVADFINGMAFKPSDWEEEGKKIIRIQNLNDPDKPYNKTTKGVSDKYLVYPEDILVSWSASLGVFEWKEPEIAVLNQHIFKVVPNEKLVWKPYLKYALNQSINSMLKYAHGSTMKHINRQEFLETQTYIPPIAEQRRIAAILDKADGIRRKRQEAIRLTEELGRSLFLDMFGDPVSNPKGWETVEIDQLVNKIDSGWSPKCDSRVANKDEWAVLKLGAITWGFFNENENKALLPDVQPKLELEVKSGDLLFARKNTYELVGATAYVKRTREKLLLPDLIFRLKTNEKVNSVFLWKLLSQESMRKEISLLASGSSGSMPNISKARLRQLKVISPPLEMQEKFNSIFEKYWIFQESSEKFQQESENLFNSLLQRAFRGEL
jgi:type I restriction enzyme S subunit